MVKRYKYLGVIIDLIKNRQNILKWQKNKLLKAIDVLYKKGTF